MLTSYRLAALLLAAVGPSQIASARQCDDPLQAAVEAVSRLPAQTPYEVPDQLQAYYDEAVELVDVNPAACLAIVARMDALIARHMHRGSGTGATALAGRSSDRQGSTVRAENAGSETDSDAILADLQSNDNERLRRRIQRASDDVAEDLAAVGAYRAASRSYVGAMRAFAAARGTAASELSEVDVAASEIDKVIRAFEDIVVVNAPDDVMHARLEDAVRSVEESRRALERAWQRYHARQASAANDHVASLSSPGFEPASLTSDFIAPLGDAETHAAQNRLRSGERALKQVRNNWDPHIHRRDRPFLDMREGYKQAYRNEYDGFAAELKAFDATLNSYLPDRIAAFTNRRAQLFERHEQRLDSIFARFAIP